MKRPEDYRWNSLGYHVQTGKKENFLSPDFGLKEFGPSEIRSAVTSELHGAGVLDTEERLKRYRRYVYEAGAINQPAKGRVKVIKDNVLERERKRAFELSRNDQFRYRTRYFTDSGIIGSKTLQRQALYV